VMDMGEGVSVSTFQFEDNERGLRKNADDNKGVFALDGNIFDPKERGGGRAAG